MKNKTLHYFKKGDLIYNDRYRIESDVIYDDCQVYYCIDTQNNENLVIKAEKIGRTRISRLENEWKIYKTLSKSDCFDIALDQFNDVDYRFMTMKRRGMNLLKFFKSERWDHNYFKSYAFQMISLLQLTHTYGVLHLDPKLSNFVLDLNDTNKLYLIDFDSAKEYIDSNGNHIQYVERDPTTLSGNKLYLSLNGHNGDEQSRRDDMLFLGYSLIYLAKGSLPWIRVRLQQFSSRKEYMDFIREQKMKYSFEELCEYSNELIEYMNHCSQLKFTETPNYEYLKQLFHRNQQSIE